MKRFTVTPAQARAAEWALSPMGDCAIDPDSDFGYGEGDLPTIEGGDTLVFPTDNLSVAGDLLYRLEQQLPDMAQQDSVDGSGLFTHASELRAARNLAEKLRAAFPGVEPLL